MARDRTLESQEATNTLGMSRTDPQVLTRSPRKERFEEDFVPQSAPAWVGTFGLPPRDQKFNALATTQLPSLEVRILCFSGYELKVSVGGGYEVSKVS
jgi:hypothetical protein